MLSWIWGRPTTKTVTDARGITRTIPNPPETTTWDARGVSRTVVQNSTAPPVTKTAWDARGVNRTFVDDVGEERVQSEIHAITSPDEFMTAIDTISGLVLIYCYADWHESTPGLMPQMEQLKEKYTHRFYRMSMDVPALNGIAADVGVRAHPCVLMYEGGEMVGKVEGQDVGRKLEEALEKREEGDDWGTEWTRP